jgi:hypothetical protein
MCSNKYAISIQLMFLCNAFPGTQHYSVTSLATCQEETNWECFEAKNVPTGDAPTLYPPKQDSRISVANSNPSLEYSYAARTYLLSTMLAK